MKRFHSVLMLVCIFTFHLKSEIEAKYFNFNILRYARSAGVDDQVLEDVETVNDALTITDEMLGLYIDVLDQAVPWRAFQQTLAELDRYRDDFSEQSSLLIGNIKFLMSNGIDAYHSASNYITRWCDTATPRLTTYVDLFRNDHTVEKAHKQKDILVELLEKGLIEMKAAQRAIGQSSMNFNGATGQLTTLNSRFQFEFNEQSAYFQDKVNNIRIGAYVGSALFGLIGLGISAALVELKYVPELKEKMAEIQSFYDKLGLKVDQAFRDVEGTKNKLNWEIIQIGDLKVKTEETKTFIDLDDIPILRDTLVQSGQSLIDKCNIYRRKHADQNNNWTIS